ncbi:MAG: hypothetical protein IKU43_06065 [Clostridia bacterium]|nr:hypothetical protein [Clostridia bacterium]
MRSKHIKDRCIKRWLKKSDDIVRTYDKVQTVYADVLDRDENVVSVRCNVPLEGEDDFTSDFVCLKKDGTLMVRECIYRKKLGLPRTSKLLDISRSYWMKRGVDDWAIVVEMEDNDE